MVEVFLDISCVEYPGLDPRIEMAHPNVCL